MLLTCRAVYVHYSCVVFEKYEYVCGPLCVYLFVALLYCTLALLQLSLEYLKRDATLPPSTRSGNKTLHNLPVGYGRVAFSAEEIEAINVSDDYQVN